MGNKKLRHIMGLSGGKDSTALALYLKDRVPDIEYFFCDTHMELPETYAYLKKLEILLGKKIKILEAKRGFDHWLAVKRGFLPSPQIRWCTEQLKLIPIERFVGNDEAISFIALRADEDRAGYISTKPNIKPVFPFIKEGLVKRDIFRIIEESGIGMPEYYNWRSRSGCYFCFFQRKIEWVRLSEIHPDLFEKSVRYEEEHDDGRKYFWNQRESLLELVARKEQIIADHKKMMHQKKRCLPNRPLIEVLDSVLDDKHEDFCFVCNL
ncbi:MAG: phosphoadenosine phosphosulfate reductase family protein [Proteobacteria bacterium]|nr:phosphoadenosine phosphosulfate reductase [Desulfobacteraceae bacterium]MBU4012828.1 phosphoadenosine phosphosulfate reductase family protein [Pseudomonadota bacterium]MBU4068630.1 phosphoadenosine phosphosulfate reductase family protein [Pseudomonadota bacterium]